MGYRGGLVKGFYSTRYVLYKISVSYSAVTGSLSEQKIYTYVMVSSWTENMLQPCSKAIRTGLRIPGTLGSIILKKNI